MEGHLSVLGVGPYYVTSIVIVSLVLIFGSGSLIPVAGYGALDIPMKILGAAMIVYGVWMWYSAVIRQKVSEDIEENRLVTDGVYACVRNPIYSAITIAVWGVLFIAGNAWSLLTVPAYWLLLTVLLKCTEEKWLTDLYGDEFTEYCGRVNRCIPWFSRR